MNRETVWTVIIGAVYLAILFMLARPDSKGPQIVNSISGALSDLIKQTTDYGS